MIKTWQCFCILSLSKRLTSAGYAIMCYTCAQRSGLWCHPAGAQLCGRKELLLLLIFWPFFPSSFLSGVALAAAPPPPSHKRVQASSACAQARILTGRGRIQKGCMGGNEVALFAQLQAECMHVLPNLLPSPQSSFCGYALVTGAWKVGSSNTSPAS